jgi:hypothetical protein
MYGEQKSKKSKGDDIKITKHDVKAYLGERLEMAARFMEP